jgi:cytosine/adenosine deaminase-related metal-dependent hydrolase
VRSLLLKGARVVTMDPQRRIVDGDVLVQDGKIAAVGRTARRPDGTTVLDCKGLVVLPGLIQAHIHLCQTLFRGLADDLALEAWLAQRIWPLEAAHTEESVYWSAMLGAAELLLGGTTAILDMETVRHTGAAFEALESIGLRATAGKCLMDAASNPASLREPTERALQESADLCAKWHGAAEGRLRYCFAPRFAPSCTGPLLRAVSDLAARAGAVIHTHAAETPLELQIVKRETGNDELAYLDSVGISGPRAALAHCVWVDKEGIARLALQRTNVVHCPSSNLKLGSGVAPIPEMLAAGCHVGLGADGAPCNNRLDAFEEMRVAALIQKPRLGPEALPAAQALELATIGGARALGLETEIGSIEVGKRADLVVLDLEGLHTQPAEADLISRIVYSARASDVRHVLVDGRLVVKDGVLKTAKVEEIRRAANVQARRLRRAVGV